MILRLVILLVCAVGFSQSAKHYSKTYYENGNLKAEGWLLNESKTDYWYFYNTDGSLNAKGSFTDDKKNGYWYFYAADEQLLKEGHYKNDEAADWWVFHKPGGISEKVQFKYGSRQGYALIYKNGTLFKAERYKNDILTGSWTSVSQFKKDNPNARF